MTKKLITLTKDDIPYPVQTVHNAGVTKFDGRYIMLFRSHLDTGRSIIGLAESDDGFNFKAGPEPFMVPSKEPVFCEYEEYGLEDPRITHIEGVYYITYSAYSANGVRTGLAKTTDFESVERVAFITQADWPLSRRPTTEIPCFSLKKSMADTSDLTGLIRTLVPGQSGLASRRTCGTGAIRDW